MPNFVRLNNDWNAEPNAPYPKVQQRENDVTLRFDLNRVAYPQFSERDEGLLTFVGCARWRLGGTNDEGWYLGQCRYSSAAPEWGHLYEIVGDDTLRDMPKDWQVIGPDPPEIRHFLFYLRDETFECMATEWAFSVTHKPSVDTAK